MSHKENSFDIWFACKQAVILKHDVLQAKQANKNNDLGLLLQYHFHLNLEFHILFFDHKVYENGFDLLQRKIIQNRFRIL